MGNSGSCVSGEKVHPKLCSQDSINYIVEKTQASKEDVEAYQENFLQNYPDGKIDKSGFSDMMKMAYPDQDIDKLKDHIFRMYDANDDGKIDFKEFMIVLTWEQADEKVHLNTLPTHIHTPWGNFRAYQKSVPGPGPARACSRTRSRNWSRSRTRSRTWCRTGSRDRTRTCSRTWPRTWSQDLVQGLVQDLVQDQDLVPGPGPGPRTIYFWIKIMEFYLKWVHMARYELILKQDGAIWHRIISKPLPTPKKGTTKDPEILKKV